MSESMPYEFVHAHALKSTINPETDRLWSNTELGVLFGYADGSGFRRRYERDLERYGRDLQVGQPQMLGQILHEVEEVGDILDVSGMSDLEIIRLRYGRIQPTMYVSDLSNDDWIDEYVSYDYFTDDPEAIAELKLAWRTLYLTELRDRVWTLEELLALLPRGYGKTESVLALFVRWFLEIREPLYIVSPSISHSKNILRRVEGQLRSPAIRRDYGDIIARVSYDREMMTITYHSAVDYTQFDPPFSIVTWNTAKEGPHPAWIHFEDVMQKEYRNIESNEDIKWKFTKTFAKMRIRRGGRRTKVTATGTRYAMEDFYSYLVDVHNFPVLHERALDEDDNMLECPNYTRYDLLAEREKDLASFETSMNNNPVPSSGTYFREEHWVAIDEMEFVDPPPHYYLVMDPARGASEFADRTAILVVRIHDGKATVCDGYVGRIDDDDKLIKVNSFYATYSPVYTLIEKTFAQIDIRKFQHIRGLVPYQDTTKNAKIVRISAMKPYFVDGLIEVVSTIQPYKYLHREYLAYNETSSTPTRKDDSIDGLSMIIQNFGRFLEKYSETQVDWSKTQDFHMTAQRQ